MHADDQDHRGNIATEEHQERAAVEFAMLRSIMQTLPAGILVLARDGRVEFANQMALNTILGHSRRDGENPVQDVDFRWHSIEGTELPRSAYPGMRALRGEVLGSRPLTLLNAAGESIPVRVHAVPVADSQGAIPYAVVHFVDVSRERAAEQIKDDFLSLISHEFRTPLTAIHGGAHLLSQQFDAMDDETRNELLQDIGEESSRLDRMLANLLSVAEIMAGRFQASTEPILIVPFLQPIVDGFRSRADAHQLTIDADDNVPPAEGDPELLKQILRNLYENAIKYSPGGGEIRTVIRRRAEWIAIEIIDNGLGIAPDHVPHVFERFRRPGADPTVRGMGLGLYLSRLLVNAQGGRIRAASDGPGKGATFIVELPISPDWEKEHEGTSGVEQAR